MQCGYANILVALAVNCTQHDCGGEVVNSVTYSDSRFQRKLVTVLQLMNSSINRAHT